MPHRHCLGSFTFTPAKKRNYLASAKIRKCMAPAKNWDKHQNLIQECPLVATINCPPLQTIAQNHSLFHQHMAPQHSYMGAGPLTIWNFFFFQKWLTIRLGQKQVPKWVSKGWYLWQNQTNDISVTEQIVVAKSKPNVLHLKWRFDGVWWKLGINLEEIGNKLEESRGCKTQTPLLHSKQESFRNLKNCLFASKCPPPGYIPYIQGGFFNWPPLKS